MNRAERYDHEYQYGEPELLGMAKRAVVATPLSLPESCGT